MDYQVCNGFRLVLARINANGVEGDFNLRFLDYIPENGLNWVGNCNELNAGKPVPRDRLERVYIGRC
jgi:hypothetical protein